MRQLAPVAGAHVAAGVVADAAHLQLDAAARGGRQEPQAAGETPP